MDRPGGAIEAYHSPSDSSPHSAGHRMHGSPTPARGSGGRLAGEDCERHEAPEPEGGERAARLNL